MEFEGRKHANDIRQVSSPAMWGNKTSPQDLDASLKDGYRDWGCHASFLQLERATHIAWVPRPVDSTIDTLMGKFATASTG